MGFLRNLLTKKQPEGTTITLWAQDEATARQLTTDQFFLMGALMGEGSSASQTFQEALGKGGSLSHKIFRNAAKGGYNVELTLTSPDTVSERTEDLKDDVKSLISQLNHADVEVRGRAAEGLGRLAERKAIRPLYQLMRAESQRMFEAGMSGLGSAEPDFTESDRLWKAQVHTKAADALKSIGSPAIPTLLEALQDKVSRYSRVRTEAARILGEMQVTEAVRPLINILNESETWYETKEIAVQALESIGGTEAEQAVRRWRSKNEKQGAGG